MGYRFEDKKIKPEDYLPTFDVRNGATLRLAFACYYFTPKPGHHPSDHDHIGWPSPDRPDNICQMKPPMKPFIGKFMPIMRTDDDLEPINLIQEGYNRAYVSYEESDYTQYLETSAWIDQDNPEMVRMYVDVNIPSFSDKPIDIRFTLFAENPSDENHTITDAVCHGIITVLPGNYM